MASLQDLITKLESAGPHKTEKTAKRVRGLLNGKFGFDTNEAVYVWEHPYYPQFYIPRKGFLKGVLEGPDEVEKATIAKLVVGSKSTDRVIIFASSPGPLSGLVKVDFESIDAWFVEEEQIYQHPKDPYKRIECIPSTRTVRIEIDGEVVAESSSNIFLYETMLQPRYYLSPTSVNWELLSPSETKSVCPYKGEAKYYDVTLKSGKVVKDAIWWYKYPTLESILITGRLCFYNEKVDVFIDGVKQ